MTVDSMSGLLREAVMISFMVAAPFLLAALVVGLTISIFQTVTSINEQTLTFVPKIVAVLGTFGLMLPWMMSTILEFAKRMLASVAQGSP